MNNAALDFSIGFILNNSPQDLTFQDITNYSGQGVTPSDVEGILRLTSPLSVFYLNAGYVANNFASPDIDGSSSFIKSGIDLPLANNDVLCGLYQFEYKAKVKFGWSVIGTSTIDNEFLTNAINVSTHIQAGQKISVYDSTTGNNGIYTVISVIAAGMNTIIKVVESVTGIASAEKIDVIYEKVKTFDYCFINPVVDINMESNCLTSILKSEDVTDYEVNGISPATTSRTHTLIYPQGVGIADIVVTTATNQAGANIWTRIWTCTVETDLSYNLNTWFNVTTTVSGMDYHDVKCSLCMCLFFNCYKAVYEKYKNVLNKNAREESRLNGVLLRIVSLYQLYNLAIQCGYNTDYYCDEIKTLLNTENCTCDTEPSDDVSIEVIPITSGGGSTTVIGTVWYNGNGVPSSSLGTTIDYYIDNASGNIYFKGSGSWVIIYNWTGAAGTSGSQILIGAGAPSVSLGVAGDMYINSTNGDYYLNIAGTWILQGNFTGATGAAGVALLHNDVTSSNSTVTNLEEVLKSYTLASTVMSNGDMIEVETIIEVGATTVLNPIYYNIRFGGLSGVLLNTVTNTNTTNAIAVSLKLQIIKISNTSARIKIFHNNYLNTPNSIKEYIMDSVVDFTINNDIVITSENTKVTPLAADIVARQLTIKHYKI